MTDKRKPKQYSTFRVTRESCERRQLRKSILDSSGQAQPREFYRYYLDGKPVLDPIEDLPGPGTYAIETMCTDMTPAGRIGITLNILTKPKESA